MELPNPDVEDVRVLLDVIPNLVVGDDLDVEAMLVEVLHVDVIQHVEDEVNHVQKRTLMKSLWSNFWKMIWMIFAK